MLIALARLSFLRSGAAVDVGANIGLISSQLSRRPDISRVLSIEPNSDVFEVLLKNCTEKMVCQEILISSSEQQEVFRQDISDSGRSGPTSGRYIEKLITGRTLDSVYLELFGTEKLNLLKIDVQGSEESVFDSAMNLITIHQPVILIEIASGDKSLDRILAERLERFLKESLGGYQAFGVRSGGVLKLLSLPVIPLDISDIFLVPNGVLVRL